MKPLPGWQWQQLPLLQGATGKPLLLPALPQQRMLRPRICRPPLLLLLWLIHCWVLWNPLRLLVQSLQLQQMLLLQWVLLHWMGGDRRWLPAKPHMWVGLGPAGVLRQLLGRREGILPRSRGVERSQGLHSATQQLFSGTTMVAWAHSFQSLGLRKAEKERQRSS